ncbi:hypothetical protein Bpfe_016793 [Biomphalaria pfeifferi]|uniref:Uncharacterized protein n=1 Tax=Biomphalaria pfeifferi TaxID=112525 RepID=A0AAD8BHD8_BIOPF|nr:hypothetical protein Bpfe_016793 [Biomphalaria pfeifferi]
MSSKVRVDKEQFEIQDVKTQNVVYAQVVKKKPKPGVKPTKPSPFIDDGPSPLLLDETNGNAIPTGSLVKESIFKLVDDGYRKFISSQLKTADDVHQRLATLEQTQSKLSTDFNDFKEQVLKDMQALHIVTEQLQMSVQKSIDQQEKFALSVHDQFTETADHLGGQLMSVLKELQEVSNNHKHMVTSLSLIVSSYVCPTVQREKQGKKIHVKQ